jgi:hypothetical protein
MDFFSGVDAVLLLPTVAVVGVVAGFAAAGFAAAFLAARRSAVQPIPQDPHAETLVLAAVAADPACYARVAALRPDAFAVPAHRRDWQTIETNVAPFDPDAPDADPDSYQPGADAADLALLLDVAAAASDRVTLLRAGETVAGWWQDRQLYRGSADWVEGDDGTLLRRRQRPSLRRRALLATLGAAAAVVSLATNPHPELSWLWWCHLAALGVLTVVAAVVASVDFDTLLIDLETTFVGVLVAAVPAGAVAFSRDGVRPLLALAAVVVALVLLLKAAEWVTLWTFSGLARLRSLRARSAAFDAYVADRSALTSALGAGDLWLLPAAFGVPYLLFGSVTLLVAMLLVACVTALVGHVAALVRGRGRFAAFGPHLMWAWVGALAVLPVVEKAVFGR